MAETIYLIVEGDGEETAAPELIRRFLYEYHQEYLFHVSAINATGRANITTAGGLEKLLEVARRKSDCRGVIVLLDTESAENCARDIAFGLSARAKLLGLPFPIAVVCATCEYESWFLTSLHTIAEKWLSLNAAFDGDPEQKCNAKEWLSDHNHGGRIYKETLDQVRMTTDLDIPYTVAHSRSFRRLSHAIEELLRAIYARKSAITPEPQL